MQVSCFVHSDLKYAEAKKKLHGDVFVLHDTKQELELLKRTVPTLSC